MDVPQDILQSPNGNPNERWFDLRLFVCGASPNSLKAIENMRLICEEHLPGRYSLEIIDVYKQEALAAAEHIIALPMLVRRKPSPERKLIGDMSQTEKVLKTLGLTTL